MNVPFQKSNQTDAVTLDEMFKLLSSDEDRRILFINLDKALKYIHDHGYCIRVFYPSKILVLNDNSEFIQFTELMEMPEDDFSQREIIKEDLFHSALIQIGLYSNTLNSLTPEFLRENFDAFSEVLPPGDISYYRGVVQRGASVYFCQFDIEKAKRDLQDLQKQFGELENNKDIPFPKSNVEEDITNKKINDVIYKQISGYRDAAFVHFLIIPTIAFVLLALFGVISWFISIIS